MTAVALALIVACGASARSGQSTLRVSASPNGESAKTGSQVLADATSALASVPAARVTGTQTSDGETQKLDLLIQADGLQGSVQTSSGSEQLLSVNGKLYTKGMESLQPSASSLLPKNLEAELEGRWVYIDPADNTDSMSMSTSSDEPMNLKGFAAGLRKLDKGVTVDPAVTTDVLHGQQVVVVSESNGSRLSVSATGEPLPLQRHQQG